MREWEENRAVPLLHLNVLLVYRHSLWRRQFLPNLTGVLFLRRQCKVLVQ